VAVAAVFALLCPAPGVGADAHAATTRPNIVVILTDDQPAQTMWAMPRTQRLLTAHGVKFTSYYDSVSLCCPARAALLTGRYAHSTLVYTNKPPFGGSFTFRNHGDDAQTLAVWLHTAGYHTGLFGKYLNGYAGGFVPPGWDTFAAMMSRVRHRWPSSAMRCGRSWAAIPESWDANCGWEVSAVRSSASCRVGSGFPIRASASGLQRR